MRNAVGLGIIIALVCFNAGLYVVEVSGLYSGVELPDGSLPEELSPNVGVENVIQFSLTTIITFLGGLTAGRLAGADPLKCGVIGAFAGSILVLFENSYKIINESVNIIAPNPGVGPVIASLFIGINAILVLIFLYQLVTGGWASYK